MSHDMSILAFVRYTKLTSDLAAKVVVVAKQLHKHCVVINRAFPDGYIQFLLITPVATASLKRSRVAFTAVGHLSFTHVNLKLDITFLLICCCNWVGTRGGKPVF